MFDIEIDTHDNDREVSFGLEIKTPSSKKLLLKKINPARTIHCLFSMCLFGNDTFKQLVYKPDNRTQILHHATAANLECILLIVLNKCKVV